MPRALAVRPPAEPAPIGTAILPPITVPRRKATSAAVEHRNENSSAPAAAKPRKATLPVMLAVKTRPRPSTLAASTSPVTPVRIRSTGTRARSRSEDIAHPAAEVRDVLRGPGLPEERAGDEVLEVGDDTRMAAEPGAHHQGGLAADVLRGGAIGRPDQVPRHSVDAVRRPRAPEEVPAGGHGRVAKGMEVDRRVQVDVVDRPDQLVLPEVRPLREERVEALQRGLVRIFVSAGDVGFQAESRPPGGLRQGEARVGG